MSGWVIAVKIDITTFTAELDPKKSEKQKQRNRAAHDAVVKTLGANVSQYSIERLYADMGSKFPDSHHH